MMRTASVIAALCAAGACGGGGGNSGVSCLGAEDCLAAGAGDTCVSGTCYATCPAGLGSPLTRMKTVSQPPSLDDVIDGETIDVTGDGIVDDMDRVGGMDFDLNGSIDNRFYFDDRSAWVPDADSFDDFEDASLGIPRGITPVSAACAADGIKTGPSVAGYDDYVPSSYCVLLVSKGAAPCILNRR